MAVAESNKRLSVTLKKVTAAKIEAEAEKKSTTFSKIAAAIIEQHYATNTQEKLSQNVQT